MRYQIKYANRKMWKKLMVMGMCLCLGGCSIGNTKEEHQTDRLSEKKVVVKTGDIYEITENNFIDGMEHAFTNDELEMWNEVYAENGFEEKENFVVKDNIKYMINLYDDKENEVGEYIIDKDGRLYDGNKNGKEIYNQKIIKLLKDIVS